MKKILLFTTITCSAIAANAEFSVKLNGMAQSQVAARNVKDVYANASLTTKNQRQFMFDTRGYVGALIEGKNDSGMKYGANLMVNLRTGQDSRNYDSFQKSYIFLEDIIGRIELGSNVDAGTILSFSAANVATATGGASTGDWYFYTPKGQIGSANFSPIAYGVSYIYRNSLVNYESERKVTFILPSIKGLQVGLSFTPDATNNGQGSNSLAVIDFTSLRNVVNLALAYNHKIKENISFGVSFAYDRGETTNNALYKLNDYNVGAKISIDNFELAGSFGDSGKSLIAKKQSSYAQKYYTAGLKYAVNKWEASVTYLNSKNGTTLLYYNITQTKALSFGVDYLVAKGMKIFAEATSFSMSNPLAQTVNATLHTNPVMLPKNKGAIFIFGSRIQL